MRRVVASVALLAAALAASGCENARTNAARYRAEQMTFDAHRAEREARLGGVRPDSAALLRLREEFSAIRRALPPPYVRAKDPAGIASGVSLLRTIGKAELSAARLAMEARRPDLALEQAEWLFQHAEGDTMTQRQADFAAIGALKQLRRFDDAIARMHLMLERYQPIPPRSSGQEDAVLQVPELMVTLRREQGDDAGAAAEVEHGIAYFQRLLGETRPPALEAQIRARLVRAFVEQGNTSAALAQLTALDAIVSAHPEYKSIEPEVRYSRAKIRAVTDKTPGDAVRLLDRVAADYPTSPFGARALLEAGVLLERHKLLADALDRYRAVVRLYPNDRSVAPVALFRQSMLEEQTGHWDDAKRTLESIPVKYPASQAAAEAPITVASRYLARKERPAALAALQRAILTYQELIAKDTTAAFTTVYRWNMLRSQLPLEKWEDALKTVDEMAEKDKGHPFTAQALLEGARVAKANRQPDRAAAYLKRYLDDYPGSPLAMRVRKDLEALLGQPATR